MKRKGKHGISTNGSIRRAIVIRDRRESTKKHFRWTKSYRKKPTKEENIDGIKPNKCCVDKKHTYCSRCNIRNCWDPIEMNSNRHRLRRVNQKILLGKIVKKMNQKKGSPHNGKLVNCSYKPY